MSDRLPNVDRATIDPVKITGYLLDAAHPEGGPKARFFFAMGFQPSEPRAMIDALLVHAQTADVTGTSVSPHGEKFILRGMLMTPNCRNPTVQAIWIIDAGEDAPRFVTAYPLRGVERDA